MNTLQPNNTEAFITEFLISPSCEPRSGVSPFGNSLDYPNLRRELRNQVAVALKLDAVIDQRYDLDVKVRLVFHFCPVDAINYDKANNS